MLLQLSFDLRERRTTTLGKTMLKSPRVDDTFGCTNAVRPSQILEKSMGMHIRHKFMSLFMVINIFKLVMRHTIYMVMFSEFTQGEMVLITRF